MHLFELAYDQHDRPLVLIEDVQRWLLEAADQSMSPYTEAYIRMLAGRLDQMETIDL